MEGVRVRVRALSSKVEGVRVRVRDRALSSLLQGGGRREPGNEARLCLATLYVPFSFLPARLSPPRWREERAWAILEERAWE